MTKDSFNQIMGVSYEEFMTLDPATREVVLRQGRNHDKDFGVIQILFEERNVKFQKLMRERLDKGREYNG